MSGLTTRVTIQTAATATTNAYGELEEGLWSTYTVTGARIRRLSARETLAGSKESNTNLFNFEIHRTTKNFTININHRILVASGSVYDIISIDTETQRDSKIIRIIAEEVL